MTSGLNTLLLLLSVWCRHEELEQLWDIKPSILQNSCFCRTFKNFPLSDGFADPCTKCFPSSSALPYSPSNPVLGCDQRWWVVRRCTEHFRVCNQRFILLIISLGSIGRNTSCYSLLTEKLLRPSTLCSVHRTDCHSRNLLLILSTFAWQSQALL